MNNLNQVKFLLILLVAVNTPTPAQSFNEVLEANFTPLSYSSSAWADVDMDGDYDLAVCGSSNTSLRQTTLYRNNLDSTFTDMLVGLPGVSFGSLEFADYDRDGDPDLLISGNTGSTRILRIYQNTNTTFSLAHDLDGISNGAAKWSDLDMDGDLDVVAIGSSASGISTRVFENQNGSFTSVNTSITPLTGAALVCGDFTGDGYPDVMTSGTDALSNRKFTLYRNNKNLSFTALSVAGIPNVTNGSLAALDIDNDGDLDFGISGQDEFSIRYLMIFKNQGNAVFLNAHSTTGGTSSSIDFGDYDNDGDVDMLATGNTGTFRFNKIFENNGAANFTDILPPFNDVYSGTATFVDFDKDSDLDVFAMGFDDSGIFAKLYRNKTSTINAVPSVPAIVSDPTSDDSVTLSWSASTDAGTVSYNVFVGTSKTNQSILSANSKISTGYHQQVSYGNAGYSTSMTLHDLPQGKYYWSVQAIDHSFAASAFAPIDSFIICRKFSLGNDSIICFGLPLIKSVGTAGDVVNWYSYNTPVIATNQFNLNFPITSTDTIWAQRSNAALGCLTYDTIFVEVNNEPVINPGSDSSICKGTSLQLGGSPTASGSIFPYTYKWYPSTGLNDSTLANPTANPLVNITYNAIVQSGDCPSDTEQVNIVVDSNPIISASNDTTIGFGESVNLFATGASSYTWSPSLNVTGPLTANPQVKPEETTVYIVIGQDANGCSDTAKVKVSVENRFFIPDLFSPDGDGNNDVFLVYGVGIQELELRVYNQSGLEVYSSNDVKELTEIGWDGKQNGKALYGQALLWTLEGKFADGTEVSYKGKKTGSLILKK
jgi:hypothetical protein